MIMCLLLMRRPENSYGCTDWKRVSGARQRLVVEVLVQYEGNGVLPHLLDECGEVDFVKARQPVVDPLMKSRSEKRLGCHHVDALDTWHSCQQIEIGHEQAIRIGNPVGHRHDNVPEGRVDGVGGQTIA